MIFLFPLDVGLVLDPLFGADVVVVVVVANDLNTAPLLCAAVIRTFISNTFFYYIIRIPQQKNGCQMAPSLQKIAFAPIFVSPLGLV